MDGQERILIVDDDEGTCTSLKLLFGRKGYQAETAGTGLEALKKAQESAFNLALLDIRLPDTEGIGLLAPLKDKNPDMAVLLVTGHASVETAVRAVEEGAAAYITKPLDMDELLTKVGDILEKQRLIEGRRRAEEALRRRNRDLELLSRATQAFSSSLDPDKVLRNILAESCRLLGVVGASVWLIDVESMAQDGSPGDLICRLALGPNSQMVRGWRLASGEGIAGWVAGNGQSIIVPDVRADQRYVDEVAKQAGLELRSVLSVPMWFKQNVIGVLQVADMEVGRFSRTDLALLESLAAAAAIAIENARLYDQAQQEIAERVRAEEAREKLIVELEAALSQVKQLEGFLPICSYCKKIRDDRNYWQQVETYIERHSEALFTHSVCPDCYEKFARPELEELRRLKNKA